MTGDPFTALGPELNARGWEQPVPLLPHPAPPEFPLDALPVWAREWVAEISAEKGACPDIGANLLLALVSGALARHVQVSPRPGWYEPTNLYAILGLIPGQRKTPVFKDALRPVRMVERRRINDHADLARAQLLAVQMYERQERDLVREVDAVEELERLVERLGDRPSEPAPVPRLLTEDVTPEGLAGLIGDHGRIVVASDEGSALFENLAGRYTRGSTSYDLFNKAHAAADLAVDRKNSAPVIVFDPALTIAIVTQPSMLRSIATKPDVGERGVLARVLYSLPRPVVADGPTPQAQEDITAEYARRITNLYSDVPELRTDDDDVPRPTVLKLARDAQAEFERWEHKINDERKRLSADMDDDGGGLFLGWVSKHAGHTARLAAVLHAAEHWTDASGAATTDIDVEATRKAIAVAGYFWEHALIVFGLMGELPAQRRARSILGWLRKRDGATVRDVHRSRGHGTTAAQVREALKLLEQHGWLCLEKQEPPSGVGRPPSDLIVVHPSISRTRPDGTDKNPQEESSSVPSGRIGGIPEQPAVHCSATRATRSFLTGSSQPGTSPKQSSTA